MPDRMTPTYTDMGAVAMGSEAALLYVVKGVSDCGVGP